MSEPLIIFDYDAIIYEVGFATETRNVEVTRLETGAKRTFKNKTEFCGIKKNVIEGWLGARNEELLAEGSPTLTREDYSIETVRVASPISHTLRTVRQHIKNLCKAVGSTNYMGYIGKGQSFRVERSTLQEYKGGPRKEALRPLQKDEITAYIVRHHKGIVVEGLEADDWCVIKGIEVPNSVVVAVDKDAAGFPINVYNPNNPDWGVRDCNCFGELQLIEKVNGKGKIDKSIKGYGRKFFYFQLLNGDSVDYYKPSCFSDTDYGEMSAYEALEDCQTDLEAFRAIVNVYKSLYPSSKEIIGWRGDTIEIDWKYVANEIFDLARMRRTPDDIIVFEDVLKKYGLI